MMYDVWFVLLPDCDLHMLSASPLEQKEEEEKAHPNKSVSGLQCLHVSPSVCLVLRLQFNFHLRLLRTHPLPCRPRPFLMTIMRRPFLWILDPPLSTSPPTWAVPWPQLIRLISTFMFYITVLNCFRLPFLFFLWLLSALHFKLPETLWRMLTMKMQTITIPSPGLTDPQKTLVSTAACFPE